MAKSKRIPQRSKRDRNDKHFNRLVNPGDKEMRGDYESRFAAYMIKQYNRRDNWDD